MVHFDLRRFGDTAWLAELDEPERIWTQTRVSVGSLACVLTLCVPTFEVYRGIIVPWTLNDAGRALVDKMLRDARGSVDAVQRLVGSLSLTAAFAPSDAEAGVYSDDVTLDSIGREIARLWQRELDEQLPDSGFRVVLIGFADDARGTTVTLVPKP